MRKDKSCLIGKKIVTIEAKTYIESDYTDYQNEVTKESDPKYSHRQINLIFDDGSSDLLLIEQSCCEVSWFESDQDYSSFTGKVIKDLTYGDDENDSTETPYRDECHEKRKYTLTFEDGTEFVFYLHTVSNGEYRATLRIN